MVGGNSISKQKGPQAFASEGYDESFLDELRAFWNNVPNPSTPAQVSNYPVGFAMTRTHYVYTHAVYDCLVF